MVNLAGGLIANSIDFTTEPYGGSVQHYYHFLLGLVVPLVSFAMLDQDFRNGRCLFIRSCGPLDRIILELHLGNIHILSPEQHREIRSQDPPPQQRMVRLKGFDNERQFDSVVFRRVSHHLKALLQNEISSVAHMLRSQRPRILIIRRDTPDEFYASASCEIKTASAQRRSISNHSEIREEISRAVGPCLEVALERSTLAEQIALFSWATVIVAQHGAALANLIWAEPPAHVIEIAPQPMRGRVERRQEFGRLAKCLGLTHEIVWQNDRHGPVDPLVLSARIAASLCNR